jgi:HTH-type transcriptional regulator / antitoxin HigA
MMARVEIRPITTEDAYNRALAQVDSLMEAEPDTPEGDLLDALVTLIEAYEKKRWPIDAPDPIDAIRFRMEQARLRPKDLEPFLGSSGRVSEVLNRRRPLTLPMIRRLVRGLGIPAEVLIQERTRRSAARSTRKGRGARIRRPVRAM